MKTITLTLTKEEIATLKHQLQAFEQRTDIPYSLFQAKLDDGSITAYQSGKVVFGGPQALIYAHSLTKENPESAGSDEVGTGDYFGPMIVCAAYYHPKYASILKDLKIMDSKQISDQQLLEEVPLFVDHIPHSLLILEPLKYNEVQQTKNLNKIKAEMHQKAYDHLKQKLGFLPAFSVVDQFTPKEKYFSYLETDYGITNLTFETKAESKYISVALAAMIARYTFVKYFENMERRYRCPFPKGSGTLVDEAGRHFVGIHGQAALKNVAKLHFKNTERIIGS